MRPEQITVTIKLVNKPNTIGMGWADTQQEITKGKKQIGKVSANIGCGLRIELQSTGKKEYAVYCVSPLDIWNAVQIALKEKNIILE